MKQPRYWDWYAEKGIKSYCDICKEECKKGVADLKTGIHYCNKCFDNRGDEK